MDPPDPPPSDENAAKARVLADQAAAAEGEGRAEDARRLIGAALEHGGADVHVLFRAFQFHFHAGELEPAEAFARRRLEAAGPGVDTPHLARAYTNLGLVLLYRKDYAAAEEAMARAVEIDRRVGFEYGLARSLGNLSLVPEELGDLDRAESLLREALVIAERIGAEDLKASKYANLGDIALRRGNRAEARALWVLAVEFLGRAGKMKYFDEYTKKIADLDTAKG